MEIPVSGGTDQAPVTVLGIPSGGLGAYQFELRYDPAVVQVTDVLGGAIPFDGAPAAVNIDNTSGAGGTGLGLVQWNDFQAGQSPVTAAQNVANVQLQSAVDATVGSCSPLTLTVIELVDNQAVAIPSVTLNGEVCLVSAVGILAETGLTADLDAGNGGVFASIDLIKDGSGPLPGTQIASYVANVTFTASEVLATDCQPHPPLDVSPTCLIGNGGNGAPADTVNLAGSGTPLVAPLDLAFVALRLLGANDVSVDVTLTFTNITDSLGSTIAQETPSIRTFLREDALADGSISISDALFIAQHLVDQIARPAGDGAGEIHPVNAASVSHDLVGGQSGTGVDIITVGDAVLLAQLLVGNVDEFYDLIP